MSIYWNSNRSQTKLQNKRYLKKNPTTFINHLHSVRVLGRMVLPKLRTMTWGRSTWLIFWLRLHFSTALWSVLEKYENCSTSLPSVSLSLEILYLQGIVRRRECEKCALLPSVYRIKLWLRSQRQGVSLSSFIVNWSLSVVSHIVSVSSLDLLLTFQFLFYGSSSDLFCRSQPFCLIYGAIDVTFKKTNTHTKKPFLYKTVCLAFAPVTSNVKRTSWDSILLVTQGIKQSVQFPLSWIN